MKWDDLASDEIIEKTTAAMKSRGIDAIVADSGKKAFEMILETIP